MPEFVEIITTDGTLQATVKFNGKDDEPVSIPNFITTEDGKVYRKVPQLTNVGPWTWLIMYQPLPTVK